ncbi:MAG TPA: DUF779 domain-containing protein [Aromatoleum sp.]|uniref:DUF779 domain-containing protein n=1 Tax=Aromatoleum sp. TaxID=2307007 RepID=UPI002B48383E|nr:DUF779 domain-containing protein [Aromatoleum sp.]HJV24457.1 DUF779 domain-containing protein [Aromatoleum sp.]
MVERVVATESALALIEQLILKHGPLVLHRPCACGEEGPANCLPQGDFIAGTADLLLGEIGGCHFYITETQHEYWQYNQLIVDVMIEVGEGESFSLEDLDSGYLHTRSRLYSTEEWALLSLKPLH